MNVVSLIGNLASDVELRELDDKRVSSFLLAVDRPGDRGADFLRVVAWNGQADSCAKYLSKGRRVAVEGRLRARSWQKDGKKASAVEIVASAVTFLSPPEAA